MSELYPHLEKQPETESEWFEALIALARYLRTPEGCPWDREQVEALDSGDNRHAREEFGDVFFTLLATAAAAEEEGRFRLGDALERIHEKMIRRHEHVFGDATAETAEDVVRVWEEAKRKEKK